MCVGVLLGLMAGCVAPIYRCNPTHRDCGKEEGESAQEVHIKICRPHQFQLSSGTSSNTSDNDRRRNSIDSNDAKEIEQVVQEAKPVSLEETPSLNWHRRPEKIDDRSTKVVQAQIEVHPRMSSPSIDETLESTTYISPAPVFRPGHNCLHNERTKKLPSIKKKMNTFKRIIVCSREKSMVPEGSGNESRKSNRVLAAQSTMLEKSGQARTLPSIRVSAIALEARPQDDEGSTKQNDSDKYSESRKDSMEESSSRTGASQEMVTLINRQSVNGKLMCDVRINGLTMNQSDLLNLFEATEGKARSVSMMTTEEAQIISIKFHRRKNDNGTVQNVDSQKQSGVPNLMIPPIYVSDYSVNDTSYRGFPKMKKDAPNCSGCRGTRRRTFWKAKVA